MIVRSTSACRTRLTGVLCRANPSVEARLATKLSSQTRASDLRQAQQMRDVRVVICNYHLLYTKSRNSQLSLFLYQLVNLSLESYIRHFDLKYIRDQFRPSRLQSGQLRSKRSLSCTRQREFVRQSKCPLTWLFLRSRLRSVVSCVRSSTAFSNCLLFASSR